LAADFKPIQIGQHQIQHDQSGGIRLHLFDRLLAIEGRSIAKSAQLNISPHQRINFGIVVDDQD
jgi:hypothetical protein